MISAGALLCGCTVFPKGSLGGMLQNVKVAAVGGKANDACLTFESGVVWTPARDLLPVQTACACMPA